MASVVDELSVVTKGSDFGVVEVSDSSSLISFAVVAPSASKLSAGVVFSTDCVDRDESESEASLVPLISPSCSSDWAARVLCLCSITAETRDSPLETGAGSPFLASGVPGGKVTGS